MEDGELNSLIEGLNANTNKLVLAQQIQQHNPQQTHFVVSPYPANTFISTSESPFPTPSPSPSIILRSPAPVKSPIAHLQNIKSPIPVKSPGFQNVKSPVQNFQNVKSPNGNFQNVKSPNIYQVKSPGVSNIKSPASGVVKSPANIRSPGVCNPQSPAQAHSPFQHQVLGSPNSNRSPAPPPPTPSPNTPSPARPNTPQPVTQYPPIAPNTNQLVQLLQQPGQLVGRAQIIPGTAQNQIHKAKQPQQILPKPLPPNSTSPQKQSVPRLNTAMSQQTPLLINQPQAPSPTLVLNQVLTSGAPVLVPAGPGGTVHLMLRPPTPTLQSGPGPPQNKMIITNTTQSQPQAAVLLPNRQQVMRIMTAQGPMQLQQIQTPSGPQFIAIPQNQTLSFPTNSVLVQSPGTNTIQLQQNATNTLQLQQNAANALQLQQNAQIFQQNTLPISQGQISLQNQILQTGIAKREDKITSPDITGASDQKKIVIDNKLNNKKNINDNSNNNNSSNFNNNKKGKTGKTKQEEELVNKNLNKNFAKVDNLISNPISVPTLTTTTTTTQQQKNITSSLRQIRPGAFANRKQNQNNEVKDNKVDDTKNLNLTRIIDSVASHTEHLDTSIKKQPQKVDNLTATINSVAEDIKSPTPDEIMSNLSLTDVFISGNKTLTLNKRPNLTIVQKENKMVQQDQVEPNLTINRLIMSPSSAGVDFENFDGMSLMASAGVQTNVSSDSFVDQSSNSSSIFQEDSKKGKKKASNKKKGRKEENKVDLWDLMKSAGIGDDEFDEPTEMSAPFSQDTATITEGLDISAAESDLLAQLQSSSQLPGGIRVVVGEDGRPVIFNGNNVLIPDPVPATANSFTEVSDPETALQNMILPENMFNFTPQALATAQTQLSQLIQDHGGLATSSADHQLLSQILGSTSNSINSTQASNNISSLVHSSVANQMSQSLPTSAPEPMLMSTASTNTINSSSNTENSQIINQKQEAKSEFIGGPPPGLPPLDRDSLVITNNNGVPTLVASPALMQYLQTHQGIIQFQHDPVTKTIQSSLIIPHPQQQKIEPPSTSDLRNDKTTTAPALAQVNLVRTATVNQSKENMATNKPKTSVGTITEEPKGVFSIVSPNQPVSNVKLNMVQLVKNNPPLLQIASETNSLIAYKENNKNLTEKESIEIDKKIQQNRAILDQCFNDQSRVIQTNAAGGGIQNVILKETGSKDNIIYQVGNFGLVDKIGTTMADKTTETQTLEDLQNLDMSLMKSFQPTPSVNSPTTFNNDFQAKYLEAIGMAVPKNTPKATVSIGTGTGSPAVVQASTPPAPMKRGRRKKNERIQNQATQADAKPEVQTVQSVQNVQNIQNVQTMQAVPVVPTINCAQLTPDQNLKLNQALQNRGVIVNQLDNLDAIKQIINEEVRKITANTMPNASIKFINAPGFQDEEEQPSSMVLNNPNLNQLLDQQTSQGNIISLQGSELVAINNGNQPQIFTSQNQILSSGHFVTSNNQILAIGGNHNQLVSLGNPINSSNQIVTLGSPSNLMSVNGNNVATPGSVIVGSNGNVVAIVHQSPVSGQGPGIVQRVQTIQLTTPKQQHFKTIQSQIQTLSSKANRTATEQSTLQKLIMEQQKILSTGKLVATVPGQHAQGMQIQVSQPVTNQQARPFQQQQVSIQTTQQAPQQQLPQLQQQEQVQVQTQQHPQAQPLQQRLQLQPPPQQQQQQQPLPPLQQPQPQQQQQQAIQQTQTQTFISVATNKTITSSTQKNFPTHASVSCGTLTSDFGSNTQQQNIPKLSVPPTVMISDAPPSSYGPLYVSPNTSGKNVTKCEKGTSPIQIQMGTQTVTNMEYRSGKMSTGTMTSPNTGKPQAVVAPAIVIQQTEALSPTWQVKPNRNQPSMSPVRNQVSTVSRTAYIEQQMRTDQTGATMPDIRTPFLSKSDAIKRLIRYHVMDEKALSPQDLATADEIFEATAQHLLDKFRAMKEKYKYLLMLESMREVSTAERIMVDRNFIIEERMELEELRDKEKRLQEELENPTISYSGNGDVIDSNIFNKTELMMDEDSIKPEAIQLVNPQDVQPERFDFETDKMISKNKSNSDIHSDPSKDNPFKLTEANRNLELAKMKSETKERKNTRTSESSPAVDSNVEPGDEDETDNISKCKAKNSRTFSDGSSKSSLDSSRDEDSGTDINAQVQSAIDSILNLQKCERMSNSPDDGSTTVKKPKKKRKIGEKCSDGSKKLKLERSPSDDEDACSDPDPILDEAIRSILTS